jgi:tetratricopeptide (TPR) repeat protein
MRRIATFGLAYLLVAASTVPVAADELSDFESARRAYDKQNYNKAARELESLVGGVVPRARSAVVRLEARKYLGATYLFLGNEKAAREQFRLLLEEDDEYDIDPVAFPRVVVQTFQQVKRRVEAERAQEKALEAERREQERTDELEQLIKQQQRITALEELASSETVERVNSRWIAALPFGIGQFQNQNRRLGIMFAVMESAFLAASIATFVGHNSLRDETPTPDEVGRAERVERALRIGNWISAAGLLSFYVAGVVEAEVRFKPVIRTTRKRDLPDDLPATGDERTQIRLELGLTGGRLKLVF